MESFLHRRQGPWFICFSMPSQLMGLRKWTTQMSIEGRGVSEPYDYSPNPACSFSLSTRKASWPTGVTKPGPGRSWLYCLSPLTRKSTVK